ncbi:MAG: TolC family protein [Planctomycetes bacterium]|nr:TolC family protein [Planctomycetota bacterium]MCB9902889.1 TolC family protein [Planctomycetota bacterium]
MHPFTPAARSAAADGTRVPGRTVAAACLILLPGCAFERYAREPLESQRVVSELVEERRALALHVAVSDGDALNLAEAADLLRERNPDLRVARAAYETARAASERDTPFPNPTLAVGPEFGFGSDAASPYVVPLVRLGVTIPTAGKRSKQDAVLDAAATVADVDYVTSCGQLYLELRRRYVALSVARAREAVQTEIVAAAEKSLDAARRLVEAGGAQALDVSLFRLEHARERARGFEARRDVADAESDLAGMLALRADALHALSAGELPRLPDPGRDLDALAAALHETHPMLLRAEARHELAERELSLEIAKQYPDLTLGAGFKDEVGVDLSLAELALGMALPIFDRNQGPILAATARRVEAKVAYGAAADRALGELERAHRAAEIAESRHLALQDEVLPAARNNVEVAYRALPAGSADALQVLDAERSLRQVELELLEAELELQLAWCDLERAFGAPLLVFDEPEEHERPVDGEAGDGR